MTGDWGRTMGVYGLLALVGLLGAVSDAVLNQWAKTSRLSWLLAAYGCWIGVATVLGLLLKQQHFSFSGAVVVFLLANTAFAILLDYLWFAGRLGTWEWAGIACAVLAMCLLEIGRSHTPGPAEPTPPAVPRAP
jgi:hypothetical protein